MKHTVYAYAALCLACSSEGSGGDASAAADLDASEDGGIEVDAAPGDVEPDDGGLANSLEVTCDRAPPLFITASLAPDETCALSAGRVLSNGVYDIAPALDGPAGCLFGYTMTIQTASCAVPGSNPSAVVQVHSAEVRLTDEQHQTILFDRTSVPLPNPFSLSATSSLVPGEGLEPATGLVFLDNVINAEHARQLSGFVGEQILVEVTLFATTTDDIDLESRRFTFPVGLCEGCLSTCISELDPDVAPDETQCNDDAGADGRICVDPDC